MAADGDGAGDGDGRESRAAARQTAMRWTLLICIAEWTVTALLCKAVPIGNHKRVMAASDHVTARYSWVAFNRPPTDDEFAQRLVWSEPAAIVLTLAAIQVARRAWPSRFDNRAG